MNPSPLESIKSRIVLLSSLLAAMWAVEVVDFVLPVIDLDHFGIRPRSAGGLTGIVLSPLLHGGFGHLVSNSVPFLLFGGLVMASGKRTFLGVSLWVVLVGGLGVWVFGRAGSVHIGASLLIFGYLGFLMSRGVFEHRVRWVLVSVVLLAAYGGMIHGVLPGQPGISWLGHLCGFLAGVAVAAFRGRLLRTDPTVAARPRMDPP